MLPTKSDLQATPSLSLMSTSTSKQIPSGEAVMLSGADDVAFAFQLFYNDSNPLPKFVCVIYTSFNCFKISVTVFIFRIYTVLLLGQI